MPLAPRKLAFLVLAGLALAAAGCSSNNKGKIEGKWKFVSAPALDATIKELEPAKAYLYMEFKPDGTMSMGAESSDPQFNEIMQKMASTKGEKTVVSWKYKLLSGDGVEFYDLPKELQEKGGGVFGKNKDKARTSVKINGDDMTMTDDDGKTGKLTRVK